MDSQAAVDRLSSQLPLKVRQDNLPPQIKTVHQYILHSLIKNGRPPSRKELIQQLGPDNIEADLQRLAADDLVVLDEDGKNPVGAYPITIEHTPHKITINGHTIHAMCALDAVSVAPMFDTEVQIDSTCHVSKTPISIHMRGSKILEALPSAQVTIGIRWQMPSGVAAHSMCMEMVFLKDRQTAEAWQNDDLENTSLFTLADAAEFGKRFFLPLLD
jgi:mercuric reductase